MNRKAEVKNLNFSYSHSALVLKSVSLPIFENKITALIGPSGCGKTTLLRCFNRMHDLYGNVKYDGSILLLPYQVGNSNVFVLRVLWRQSLIFYYWMNPHPLWIRFQQLTSKSL